MRICTPLMLAAIILCWDGDAASQQPPAEPQKPEADMVLSTTMREIIQSMIVPQSDALWAAVSVTITARGTVENGPKTDDEWMKLRRDAVTLAEASNLIVLTSRPVARPGEGPLDPKAHLTPAEIEKLIATNRENWVKFSNSMHQSARMAVQAIDARNTRDLSAAADSLTRSCDGCHRQYWFSKQQRNREFDRFGR
jgi:hypothetical protein